MRLLHAFLPLMALMLYSADGSAAETRTPRPLQVSETGRFLVTSDGKPFFWLGDTAWRLQLLPPRDLAFYLDTRKAQGFNVIQGPILSRDSADYRGTANDDPANPNEAFFAHIDRIVAATARRGLYSALVVIWGHGFNAFDGPEGARRYGMWLGARYRGRTNVVWIVAGEYAIDRHDEASLAIWRALGEGLRAGSEGRNLITVHGSWAPPRLQTPSTFYHADAFLDFNMVQTGQGGNYTEGAASWRLIESDYRKTPTKPVIDGEATYEHPAIGDKPAWDGFGVRRRAYWSVFAGGFGHTYGAEPIPYFQMGWKDALNWEGGTTMVHLRRLIESRPMLRRIPDQDLIVEERAAGDTSRCKPGPIPCGVPDHVQATRDAAGRYAMIYIPGGGRTVSIDASRLAGERLVAWWYDPSEGSARRIGTFARANTLRFTTPRGRDWVLVIDDATAGYAAPGRT
ncbi:MAG TPA: glycoside hydrolase family 140 protein [Alphaproteobacteria bacterium]|nr:glycoside hydrolase family 140 protein [Alphaproteobacteria bacterium]